jgi:hypothetical protein
MCCGVVGEESPFVAVSVGDCDSDSVVATFGGRLEEFNFMGKPIVWAFLPWLHRFGGSQLFHRLRKLVLGKVAGEFVLVRSPPLYGIPYF